MYGQTTCRACLSKNLYCYLPLGDHPPANAFRKPEQLEAGESAYPLDTHVCLDCGLIQIPDPLPKDYYVDYLYVPSASTTMPVHFRALAKRFKSELITAPDQYIVDIGCNDGLLLAAANDEGVKTLGIDPSTNIGALAVARGVNVVNAYFSEETGKKVAESHGKAQVIVTTNTLNHIDNLHDFMRGVDALLAPEGTFVIEAPQALTCVEHNEFDTVYHEHLSVFSAASVAAMGAVVGLRLVAIDELPIHGGSMRYYLKRGGAPSPAVTAFLKKEKDAGLFSKETYDAHAARVEVIRKDLMSLLAKLKAEGKKLAGYSAPAKGNTLLNYYGIGPDLLDFIADKNSLKHGRMTPGSLIPIVSPDVIDEKNPDYLLILAWNFKDEILEQLEPYRQRGGKFILPIPAVEVIS